MSAVALDCRLPSTWACRQPEGPACQGSDALPARNLPSHHCHHQRLATTPPATATKTRDTVTAFYSRRARRRHDFKQKRNISAGEMYLQICIEWTADHLVMVWRKSINFWRRYAAQKTTLRLNLRSQWPWSLTLDLKFALLVTLLQHCVFAKLQISNLYGFPM